MDHEHGGDTHKTIYTCPMHPDVIEHERGNCPLCHMALEKKQIDMSHTGYDHSGHDTHAGHNPDIFKQKFWVSLLLTIPVVLYSSTVSNLFSYSMPTFPGSSWIPPVLGTILFFYGGVVFLKSAKAELANRAPGMMTLISLAISVSFIYSLAVTFGLDGMDFWWELATLITVMLLGHWIEMASVMNAQGALQELAKLLPDEAERVTTDGTETVATAALKAGDIVLVRPGSAIPTDGEVTKGDSDVNESMLTGESKAVNKTKKSEVIGGTINGTGALTIKVTKTGDDTALAGIMKLVESAQKSKSKSQVIADRAAFYLTFIAIGAAILTAIGWSLFSDESTAFILERVVTVLIIACPHALGLAVPLVTAISTSLAASNGLLIRDRVALESARNLDIILFDKTGTLTKGKQGVIDVVSDGIASNKLLALASAVELESEHPIARAIVRFANENKTTIPNVKNFSTLPGIGAQADADGHTIYVGGPRLLEKISVTQSPNMQQAFETASTEGKTAVYIIQGKKALGIIILADVIRPESREAVRMLHKSGKRVAMLTGDATGVAKWVAAELGIKEYFAEVLPGNKADVVKQLQRDGSKIAMVGDGVNDAPALVQADVGIAIGAGTDVAIESAGIILVSSDPRGVSKIITLSKATYRKMAQNLFWGAGYNIVAIPLATGITGFILSPALGAVLMSMSTVIVAVNAQFLRKLNLEEN